jgi:FkbM family methyltransferase
MKLHQHDEYISNEIREFKSHYELKNLLLVSVLCDASRFVDVGANIGNHSHFFAQLGAVGVAFEPQKDNFSLLQKNVPKFSTYNSALGNQSGEGELRVFEGSMGNNRLNISGAVTDAGFGLEKVRIQRLDEFAINQCTLLKIDAEGSELEVLEGGRETILSCMPIVWIELHTDKNLILSGYTYTREDICNFFESLGYLSFLKLDETNFLFSPSRKMFFKSLTLFK